MLTELCDALRIGMTEKQRAQFREKLVRGLKVRVDSDGEMSVRIEG